MNRPYAAASAYPALPVREALRQLSGTGLVEVVPQKGVMVSRIDVEQLTDMFDALGEFEGLCARLCAETYDAFGTAARASAQ